MDTIFIDQLVVETVIGIYDWERRIRQRVVIDLEMDFDIRAAAADDEVAYTLDYKAVTKRVIAYVEAAEFGLVETLSERVAALILAEFPVARVSLRLDKPHALRGAAGVGIRITRARTPVYVGVGSNIAPREHVPQAIAALRARFGALAVSQVYCCPAVGFDGDDFVNLVVGFTTTAAMDETQQALREIESACGRSRRLRRGSRTMDLDLLLYGDAIIDTPDLKLPRADIRDYAFVLRPLAELAPRSRHPVLDRSYAALWTEFDDRDQPLTPIELPGVASG